MKLKNKLILSITLLILSSILLISFINYSISIRKLESELDNRIQISVEKVSDTLNDWLYVEKQKINEVIDDIVYLDNFDLEYTSNFLDNASKRNENNTIYYVNVNGVHIEGKPYNSDSLKIANTDFTNREWYKGAMDTDDYYVSSPYIDSNTSQLAIAIARNFKTKSGTKGVIGSDILVDDLVSIVENLDLEGDSYAFLLDNDGNFLTHRDDNLKLKTEDSINISDIENEKLIKIMNSQDNNLYDRKAKSLDGVNRYFYFSPIDESDWKIGVAMDEEIATGDINSAIKYTILTTIGILIISILISVSISNSITNPIKNTVEIAKHISNLDLSKNIDEKDLNRSDEMGDISRSFNMIKESLVVFIENLKNTIHINNQVYEETIANLDNLNIQGQDTSATTEELSAAMEETTASTNNVQTAIEEIVVMISSFTDLIEESSSVSDKIRIESEELSENIKKSRDLTMSKYSESKENMQQAIESAKEVEKINILTNSISDIAEQTTLLSLNAAIEAARAGEAGSGFKIVAEEIRTLAEDSNATVDQIQSITKVINDSILRLVKDSTELIDLIETEVIAHYEQAVEGSERFKEGGTILNNSFDQIHSNSRKIETTIERINESMSDIAMIIEESTNSTLNIAEKNSEVSNSIYEINEIMNHNKEISNTLEDMVAEVDI